MSLRARTLSNFFARIAEQVERGVNQANELADVQRLLGRSGTELLPTMQAGLGGAVAESMRIGAPMTAQQVRDYAAASDQLTKLNQQISQLRYGAIDLTAELAASAAINTTVGRYAISRGGEARTERLQTILAEKQALEALNAIKANTSPLNRP